MLVFYPVIVQSCASIDFRQFLAILCCRIQACVRHRRMKHSSDHSGRVCIERSCLICKNFCCSSGSPLLLLCGIVDVIAQYLVSKKYQDFCEPNRSFGILLETVNSSVSGGHLVAQQSWSVLCCILVQEAWKSRAAWKCRALK